MTPRLLDYAAASLRPALPGRYIDVLKYLDITIGGTSDLRGVIGCRYRCRGRYRWRLGGPTNKTRSARAGCTRHRAQRAAISEAGGVMLLVKRAVLRRARAEPALSRRCGASARSRRGGAQTGARADAESISGPLLDLDTPHHSDTAIPNKMEILKDTTSSNGRAQRREKTYKGQTAAVDAAILAATGYRGTRKLSKERCGSFYNSVL